MMKKWCSGQIDARLRACFWKKHQKGDQVQTHCCQSKTRQKSKRKIKCEYKYLKLSISNTYLKSCDDWSLQRSLMKWRKTGCRNTKLQQEMECIAHVWKSSAACAHEEDDIKQTRQHGDKL